MEDPPLTPSKKDTEGRRLSERQELIREFTDTHEKILLSTLSSDFAEAINGRSKDLIEQLHDYTDFLRIQNEAIQKTIEQIQSWFKTRVLLHKFLLSFIKALKYQPEEVVATENYVQLFIIQEFIEFTRQMEKSREKITELLLSIAELEKIRENAKIDQESLELYLEIIEYDEREKGSLVEVFLMSYAQGNFSEAKSTLQHLKENFEHMCL